MLVFVAFWLCSAKGSNGGKSSFTIAWEGVPCNLKDKPERTMSSPQAAHCRRLGDSGFHGSLRFRIRLYTCRTALKPERKETYRENKKRKKRPKPCGSTGGIRGEIKPAGRKQPTEGFQQRQENGDIQKNGAQEQRDGKHSRKKESAS